MFQKHFAGIIGVMLAYRMLLVFVILLLAGCAAPMTAAPGLPQIAAGTSAHSPVFSESASADSPATARPSPFPSLTPTPQPTSTIQPSSTPQPTSTPQATATLVHIRTLGLSRGGNPIEIYRFGQGPDAIVLVGGIHGGYEWNTILLAYEMIDYFEQASSDVPDGISLYIIPAANPDGLADIIGHVGRFSTKEIPAVTFSGRFNADGVDLNRNWDCKWQPDGQWRDQKINAGSAPFSEPENQILRDFFIGLPAKAVIWWHSAMPGVFAGGCTGDYPASLGLAKVYADGSGYPVQKSFTGYEVTGDASDWLSLESIPSISVELTTHEQTDFKANLGGVLSLLEMPALATPTTSASSALPVMTP